MSEPLFEMRDAGKRRGGIEALCGVSVELSGGCFVALAGLNGAGKSTMLEVLAGLLRDYSGSCRFRGRELRDWRPRELARQVSFLPQAQSGRVPLPVEQVVLMGRHPFRDRWHDSPDDLRIMRDAMDRAGCTEFRGRRFDALSGGERQRVLIAAALAQQPAALLLDEPATFLDLPHQVHVFHLLRDLCREGLLCVAATHDLNLAATYCDRLLLLDHGRLAMAGDPGLVFDDPRFAEVFGPTIRPGRTPSGHPWIWYGE